MKRRPDPLRVIILGATSGIAEATARLYAEDEAELLLVGRHADRLGEMAKDLRLRGAARAEIAITDLAPIEDAMSALEGFVATLGGVDHILLAYGILGDQAVSASDPLAADNILVVNFNSAVAWCLAAANILEAQGRGSLVVLGSVAGDRGKRTNFVYGAAKAGLAVLVEGIAHRFAAKGPRAVIVKPGPTVTAMTEGMNRKGILWSKPEQIAAIVRRAAGQDNPVVYAPQFWRFVMLVIRFLPTSIYNRLDI